MIKFKITPERFMEACNTFEYIGITNGNKGLALRSIHRFIVDKDGEYVVKVTLDEDGDIAGLEQEKEAFVMLGVLTPKRLEKLSKELLEAAKAIVNPPSAGA